jgi:hydrogenase maturation factor
VRHRFARGLLNEILKATRLEKLTLLLPFIVAIIDAEIFYYSITRKEELIIMFSGFVLFLSVLEIIAVLEEIKMYVERARRKEEIEERLMKIAKTIENPTVKRLIDEFLKEYEGYSSQEIYPIACRIIDLLKKG